jgi:cell division protein FtsI (penicillin-binding protein 3)
MIPDSFSPHEQHPAPHPDAGIDGMQQPAVRILKRESAEKRQVGQCRSRLILVLFFIGMSYLMLAIRVTEVSLAGLWDTPNTSSSSYATHSARNQEGKPLLRGSRGKIIDRNGVLLAGSLTTRSLYANPRLVNRFGAEKTAIALHQIMPDLDQKKLLTMLSSDKTFVYIKRHLNPQEQKKVNELGVPGLEFEEGSRRIYPLGRLFSHAIGFVDIDNKGISGIERHFNNQLTDGKSAIQLALDERVQHIVYEELQQGIKDFQAIGGVGIVMDIHTGELLSLVSLPDFDPNQPKTATNEARFNRASLGVYEMGSTFKTFTMAMALHYGTTKLENTYDTTHAIRIGGFSITDTHPENRWLSVPEIYVHSSNIGTVRMIMEVGIERQKRFLESLGLFKKVDVEIPELASPLIPNPWHEINMMTVSYGHGISVTPLHITRAIGSLLGDGKLLKLTLMKQDKTATHAPDSPSILSTEVTRNLRKLMRLVVQYGTGKQADAAGYRVGGKTGTAEKVKAGGYAGNDKIASFIGIYPSEEPRYVVLAMIDEPRGNKKTYGFATGGWVAAPVVGKIVSRMAPLYGIQPIYELPEEKLSPEEEKRRKQGIIHNIEF